MDHKDINDYMPKAAFSSDPISLMIYASFKESHRRKKLEMAYDDTRKAFDQYKHNIRWNEQLILQSYPRKIRNQLNRRDLA